LRGELTERGVDRAFQIEAFGNRLDHQVGLGNSVVERGREADVADCGIGLAVHRTGDAVRLVELGEPGKAALGLLHDLIADVVRRHCIAVKRCLEGDLRAENTRAHHGDIADCGHVCLPPICLSLLSVAEFAPAPSQMRNPTARKFREAMSN